MSAKTLADSLLAAIGAHIDAEIALCKAPSDACNGAENELSVKTYCALNDCVDAMLLCNTELLAALQAAIECGLIPSSSAREGGACAHSRQAQVADQVRDAVAKATGSAS